MMMPTATLQIHQDKLRARNGRQHLAVFKKVLNIFIGQYMVKM